MTSQTKNNIALRIYYAALIILIYGAPFWLLLRSSIEASPNLLRVLQITPLPNIIYLIGIPIALIAFGLGSTINPIRGEPFRLYLIGTAPDDRRLGYGSSLIRIGLWAITMCAGLAILLWSLMPAMLRDTAGLLMGLIAAIAVGVLILAFWLAGSVVSPLVARLGATLAFIIIALAYIFAPGGMPGVSSHISLHALLGITFATLLLSAVIIVAALDYTSSDRVIEQALRWQNMVGLAGIGDLAAARSHMRASSTIARRLATPVISKRYGTGAWFSLLALVRAPWRIIWIIALETLAMILVSVAINGSGILPIAIAGVAQHLAIALFSDRISFTVELMRPPSLLGGSTIHNLGAQLLLPAVIHVIAAIISFVLMRHFLAINIAMIGLWSLALVPVHLLTLIYYTNKQQPPLWVQNPITSPLGDFSGAAMRLWQFDFILFVATLSVSIFIFLGN